jgi:hypothetical protein
MNAPADEKTMKAKAVPLKAEVAVIKSPKLPVAKRDYADFDEFVNIADRMVVGYEDAYRIGEAIEKCLDEGKPLGSVIDLGQRVMRNKERYLKLYEQFRAYELIYDDEDRFYEKGGKRIIKRRFVAEQVALLIGSFPNANPHSPEVYSKMLIEEIVADRPHAIVLESACRHIRRNEKFKFPPAISEVLKVIDEQDSRWCARWEAGADHDDEGGIPGVFEHLEGVLPKAKEAYAKQKFEAELNAAIKEAEDKEWAEKQTKRLIIESHRLGYRRVHDGEAIEDVLRGMPSHLAPNGGRYDEWFAFCAGCFEACRMLRKQMHEEHERYGQ